MMTTKLTKQEFLALLTSMLPDGDDKQALITAAKSLIPSDFNQTQVAALHNSRYIQSAFWAYKTLCSEAGDNRPSIDRVVAWLLDIGAVDYATTLEKKLMEVNKIAMAFGSIHSMEERFLITGADLLELRIHSSIDPKLK
jgi:hypothetical protein